MADNRIRGNKPHVSFIGLGVMGESMCRHILQKGLGEAVSRVSGFDLSADPLNRLQKHGLEIADGIAACVDAGDMILLSLPGDKELEALCRAEDGLLASVRAGQAVVDLGTTSVKLSRELRDEFAALGVAYADAPVARTRAAAETGTLLVLAGASKEIFERIRPVLFCFAEEVLHCGEVGAGQVVKQMNNMVLFQTVTALSEALTIAGDAGVDGQVLFDAFELGSANSFALANHGHKALLPGEFPERAFPTSYALKDLGYAIGLAEEHGIKVEGAEATRRTFETAIAAGYGDEYFPAIIKTLQKTEGSDEA